MVLVGFDVNVSFSLTLMFLFLFFDVNCRELFVNFFFLTANFANFANACAGQFLANYSKATQVGRVLRGSGGSLVILAGERWFA